MKIIETVEAVGIEPFQAPEPLPPIDIDNIDLICWMAIDAVD